MVWQYRVFDTHRIRDSNRLASQVSLRLLGSYRLSYTLCTMVGSMDVNPILGAVQRSGYPYSGSDDFVDITFADLPSRRADNGGFRPRRARPRSTSFRCV